MLKKLLAGLTAIALSFGMVALTAGPAAATTEETCQTFERDGGLTWDSNSQVVLAFNGVTLTKPANNHNNITVSGSPSSITIFSNGGVQDRTGQTLLNGDYGSDIQWVKVCVIPTPPPPPPVADPTPYVLVAWAMPTAPVSLTSPTWPQSFFTKLDLATKDLNALDGQLTACGTQYQVDLYNDSAKTTALIAGGVLTNPHQPLPEDFPDPSGWNVTYKLIRNADCETTPTPATFTSAQCTAGSPGQASYEIPATTGVKYTVRINGAGGFTEKAAGSYDVPVGTKVEVKAVALAGHTLTGTTQWSTIFAKPDCRITPATPTFTSAVCSTSDAGTYGKATYTIPDAEGVTYQVRVNGGSWIVKAAGIHEVGAGADVEVRALALPGYTLKGTTKWAKDFTAPDCLTDVIPTKPTKTEAVCTGEEQVGAASFTIPEITGVTYQRLVGFTWVDVAPGSHPAVDGSLVTLRAVPLPGFELTDHDWLSSKKTYLLLFDNLNAAKDCIVPSQPTFDPQECTTAGDPSQASYTIPSDLGVTYEVWDGTAWVTAPAGSYDVDTLPTTIEVRAVPKSGHHFLDGATTEWSFEFTSAGDCIEQAPVGAVTEVDQTCVVQGDILRGGKFAATVLSEIGVYVSGWITIPSTPHVDYFIAPDLVTPVAAGDHELPPGSYTVHAVAHPGYELTGYDGPWVLEIEESAPCGDLPDLPVVTPVVTFIQTTCSVSGSYTLAVEPAEESAGVIWTVSGGLPNTLGTHDVSTAGTVTITATAAPGYGLTETEEEFIQWTFDFTTLPDDCLPTLALTGGGIAAGGLGLSGLLVLGGILLIGTRQRVGRFVE